MLCIIHITRLLQFSEDIFIAYPHHGKSQSSSIGFHCLVLWQLTYVWSLERALSMPLWVTYIKKSRYKQQCVIGQVQSMHATHAHNLLQSPSFIASPLWDYHALNLWLFSQLLRVPRSRHIPPWNPWHHGLVISVFEWSRSPHGPPPPIPQFSSGSQGSLSRPVSSLPCCRLLPGRTMYICYLNSFI